MGHEIDLLLDLGPSHTDRAQVGDDGGLGLLPGLGVLEKAEWSTRRPGSSDLRRGPGVSEAGVRRASVGRTIGPPEERERGPANDQNQDRLHAALPSRGGSTST
jgi:hypothetical protein